MKPNRSSRSIFPAALVALTLVTLGQLVWRFSEHGPGFQGSESYSDIARYVLAHGEFADSFRPPLYPLFLAMTMVLSPEHWELVAALLQGVAGICLGLLLVRSAEKLTDDSKLAGTFALLLYIGNILFQFELMAKRETAFFTLLLLVFLTAPIYISDLRRRYVLMALSAALAFLLRPNAIVLIPLFVVSAWLDRREKNFSGGALILSAVTFFALIAPWQVFVYRQTASFPFTTSSNSGQTLWKGNNPYLFQVYPKVDVDLLESEMSRLIGGQDIKTPKADGELKLRAKEYIVEHPLLALRAAVLKAVLFFSPIPVPIGSANVTIENGVAHVDQFRARSSLILAAGTLLGLAVLGGWIGFLRHRWRAVDSRVWIVFSAGLTLMLLAVHTLTYPELRYRMPLDIYLTVLAAAYFGTYFHRRLSSSEPLANG